MTPVLAVHLRELTTNKTKATASPVASKKVKAKDKPSEVKNDSTTNVKQSKSGDKGKTTAKKAEKTTEKKNLTTNSPSKEKNKDQGRKSRAGSLLVSPM